MDIKMTTATDKPKVNPARVVLLRAETPGRETRKVYGAGKRPSKTKSVTVRGKAVSSFLGKNLGDPVRLIEETRRGIPAKRVVDLTEALGVNRTYLYESTRLGRSTIEGKITKNEGLSPRDSEVILRVTKVLARAVEVLEDEEAAKSWMKRSIRTLGGVAPLSLLDTETGYELVLDTLGRIEQGIAA